MSYDNNNRGAIWKNTKREKDTHPHFTGSATIEGVEYWVSAWKRGEDDKPDAPALRFTVKPKEERKPKPARAEQPTEFDDDIPF